MNKGGIFRFEGAGENIMLPKVIFIVLLLFQGPLDFKIKIFTSFKPLNQSFNK